MKLVGSMCLEYNSVDHGLLLHNSDRWCITTAANPFDFHLLCPASVLCFSVFSFAWFTGFFYFLLNHNVLAVLLRSVWENVGSWTDHFIVVKIADVALFSER